jgi:hypothetical protein
MHENNNLLSIASGSGLGIYTYLQNGMYSEHFHVLIVGILGGAGGYIGKFIIHKVVQFCKNNK